MAIADRVGLLRRGVLVQIGTAVDVYRQPCEPDVADFFGQVNWVEGVVVACSPTAVETSVGILEISAAGESQSGQRVRLGIRPECVVPVDGQVANVRNVLDARIISTTFLGEQVVSQLAVGDMRLISKTRTVPSTNNTGCVRVAVDPDDIMSFPLGR
jgi:iron(III) transport system ATP-binding protein